MVNVVNQRWWSMTRAILLFMCIVKIETFLAQRIREILFFFILFHFIFVFVLQNVAKMVHFMNYLCFTFCCIFHIHFYQFFFLCSLIFFRRLCFSDFFFIIKYFLWCMNHRLLRIFVTQEKRIQQVNYECFFCPIGLLHL